jgi:hypothetical protein
VKIARATVEMMRASELRKRRNMGGFFGADRMRPMEYFIVCWRPFSRVDKTVTGMAGVSTAVEVTANHSRWKCIKRSNLSWSV